MKSRARLCSLWNVIEQLVHRLKSEIRHPDFIDIRIAQRHAQLRAALDRPALFGGESLLATLYNSHKALLVLCHPLSVIFRG